MGVTSGLFIRRGKLLDLMIDENILGASKAQEGVAKGRKTKQSKMEKLRRRPWARSMVVFLGEPFTAV